MAILQTSSSQEVHKLKDSPSQCYSCGQLSHHQNQCKFRNSTCFYCGKRGHIQTVCRSRKSSNSSSSTSSQPRSKSESTSSSYTRHRSSRPSRNCLNQLPPSDIKTITADESVTEKESIPKEPEGEYTLFNVTSNSQPPLYVSLIVNNVSLTMEVDTGASFSVISKQTYDNSFASYPLQKTSVKLKTYSGESLTMYGEFVPSIQYQDQKTELSLVVAGNDGPCLLGRNWLHSIRLDWNSLFHLADHRQNDLLVKYSSVFSEGLGTLKGYKAKLYVKEDKPIFCKARPVPYALRSHVEAELERLVQHKIIEPISFSDWAAPIVPVMKSDKSVRICGDFKLTVNRVSKLDRHPIPKVEDLFAKLSGGVIFSKLDLSSAYQQLELDEESKQYTVINTHRGLFHFNRLPFGISSAPGIFQRTMENLLNGIPRVIVYLDDILVSGVSKEDHLHNLQLVFERLHSAGLFLKKDKCKFCVNSISYLGHKINCEGLHPLPDKIDGITKAELLCKIHPKFGNRAISAVSTTQ